MGTGRNDPFVWQTNKVLPAIICLFLKQFMVATVVTQRLLRRRKIRPGVCYVFHLFLLINGAKVPSVGLVKARQLSPLTVIFAPFKNLKQCD